MAVLTLIRMLTSEFERSCEGVMNYLLILVVVLALVCVGVAILYAIIAGDRHTFPGASQRSRARTSAIISGLVGILLACLAYYMYRQAGQKVTRSGKVY